MSDYISHREEYKGFIIEIRPDQDPMNPREDCDNLGTMVCFHRRYTLGDKHQIRHEDYAGWDQMREQAIEGDLKAVVVLPLYLYDHGGITMRTGSFGDRWDSGCVGFIYTTEADILKWYGKKKMTPALLKKAEACLEAEVKVYDQFLTGDIYGYTILDEEGEDPDYATYGSNSCWGYFGEDECLKEARACADVFAETRDKDYQAVFKEKLAAGITVPRNLPELPAAKGEGGIPNDQR